MRPKTAQKSCSVKGCFNKLKLHLKKSTTSGESNGMSKLTNHEVLAIYFLAHTGKFKLKEIANLFDTDYRNVSLIKLGKRWGHLTDVYKIINRVEELEEHVKVLEERNQRYKQSLEYIRELTEYYYRTKKALEGDND